METAVWAAFLGGAFGWIVRSFFDIFYVNRRDRIQLLNLIRADLSSLQSTASALGQEEFITALSRIDKVGKEFVDELYITACVRAQTVDTRVVERFGSGLYKVEPSLQSKIVSVYRSLVTIRLLYDKVLTHYEKDELETASKVAMRLSTLSSRLKREAMQLVGDIH